MIGCGGGASLNEAIPSFVESPLDVGCPNDRFVPNYTDQTSHLYRLRRLPVVVYFFRGDGYTPEREAIVRAAFSQWVTAANRPLLTYRVVDDPGAANVKVAFSTSMPDGLWGGLYLDFYKYDEVLNGGTITLNVADEATPARLQASAAHEFGHVLGLNVHTKDCSDIMVGDFYCGFPKTPPSLSERDVNTLKTAYCWLY